MGDYLDEAEEGMVGVAEVMGVAGGIACSRAHRRRWWRSRRGGGLPHCREDVGCDGGVPAEAVEDEV